MKHSGFTLLELLIALIVLSILSGLAAPGLSGLLQSQQRLIAARELASGIRTARVAAITRNQQVSIQAFNENWSNGWQIIAEHNGQRPDGPVLVERLLDGKVRIVGNSKVAQKLTFTGLGGLRGGGNGTIHVCIKDQPASHYRVVVAITGHVRVVERQADQPLCG